MVGVLFCSWRMPLWLGALTAGGMVDMAYAGSPRARWTSWLRARAIASPTRSTARGTRSRLIRSGSRGYRFEVGATLPSFMRVLTSQGLSRSTTAGRAGWERAHTLLPIRTFLGRFWSGCAGPQPGHRPHQLGGRSPSAVVDVKGQLRSTTAGRAGWGTESFTPIVSCFSPKELAIRRLAGVY